MKPPFHAGPIVQTSPPAARASARRTGSRALLRCATAAVAMAGVGATATTAVAGGSHPAHRAAAVRRPALRLQAGRLEWQPVAGASRYVVEALGGASGTHRPTYRLVRGTSFRPRRRRAGITMRYRVRANIPRARWTRTVAVHYAARTPVRTTATAGTATAFTVSVKGRRVSWRSVAGATGYLAAVSTAPRGAAGRVTTYTNIGRVTNWTPPTDHGRTLYYGIGAVAPGGTRWSANEVSVAWPAAPGTTVGSGSPVSTPTAPSGTPPSTPAPSSSATPMLVGINETDGGQAVAQTVASNFQIDRMEVDDGESATDFTQAGVKVDLLFSGPYESGGVSALNATSWAQGAVAIFQSQCGGSAQNCPSVEVLNEPSGYWFWGPNAQSPANEAAYANLIVTTYNAFHARYGSASPAVLAAFESPGWWQGVTAADPGIGNYYNGVTVHPYGGATNSAQSALGNRSLVTAAHMMTGKPVWVTEVGWPTAVGQSATGDSLQWTEAQQADNINGFVNWARSTGYVASVMLFNYGDYGTNMWYGVVRPNGTRKPGFTALAEATAQQPCTVCG